MQFVSGWLVDRFNVIVVIAAGYLIWSVATTATGFVQGFTLLIIVRRYWSDQHQPYSVAAKWRELSFDGG